MILHNLVPLTCKVYCQAQPLNPTLANPANQTALANLATQATLATQPPSDSPGVDLTKQP